MFWERGSLLATAITPIIVALVTEALNRPTKVITQVAPRVTRRTGTGAAVRAEQPTGVGARGEGPERVARWGDEDDPFGLRDPGAQAAPRLPVEARHRHRPLAAVIGAAVVTASELAIFGHSVGSGKERSTSVFGGSSSNSTDEEETPTPTATDGTAHGGRRDARGDRDADARATETATPTPSASRHARPPRRRSTATPAPTDRPAPTTPTIAPTP